MELIVAVYDDWGIGANGTQPIALSADRKFFRETTRGATVIVGRRTIEDFPGKKPLPGRVNIALTRSGQPIPGFTVCASPQEALETAGEERVMVIGGGSIYKQMLPYCDTAYITKVHACPESDTFFPNLDESPDWEVACESEIMEENGLRFQYVDYVPRQEEEDDFLPVISRPDAFAPVDGFSPFSGF